jgi:ribonuclease J
MLSVTKPKFFMPVHGEYKHLKRHADIAESLNIKAARIVIAKNGDVLELTKKSFKVVNKIQLSEMYVDGTEIGDVAGEVIRERHLMSTDGIIFITSVISQGMALCEPAIAAKGFLSKENTKIHNLLKKEIEDKIRRLLIERRSADEIEDQLQKSVRNYLFKITRRNPLIVVRVLEV